MAAIKDPEVARVLDQPVQQEGGECCDPACGPDTCGSEQVLQIEIARSDQPEAQAGQCCDPECGPGTCA